MPDVIPAALQYPPTQAEQTGDRCFGVSVPDPFRWLEQDVRQSPQVRAWVDAQNVVTARYLAELPGIAGFRERLAALWDFQKFGCPVRKGGHDFFECNSGLQNQSVLHRQSITGDASVVVLDPNTWSTDGSVSLAQWTPSEDGRRIAYGIQEGGSDWRTIRVRDLATEQDLADTLRWVKFSGISWAHDGSGFYYSRFPQPDAGTEFQSRNQHQAVYFHRLGEPQAADRMVYGTPDRPTLGHSAAVTDDGRWLVITTYEGTDARYEIILQDLREGSPPRCLITGLEHAWILAGASGDLLYFVTDLDAPRYRVVSVDPANSRLREVIGESADTIADASIHGGRLIVHRLVDVQSVVHSYDLDGRDKRVVRLPGAGAVSGFSGTAHDDVCFFSYTSFATPATIYRLEIGRHEVVVWKSPVLPFDPADYSVRQEFCCSRDGTRVPMFIVSKSGLEGPGPTVLYGYGGFNVSLTPGYSSARLAWLAAGGRFVVVNLRGGGEYGKAWHDGGRLLQKQNVFDDCIAAAEHLIATGVTTAAQLALLGGSNGGLLVGAVVNQRPDLFAAAAPQVGVMDMLRYTQFTAGRYWIDDYGNPAEEKHFRNLLRYSPYHNVRAGLTYPAILVLTADTDDRVVPGHSFKYVAQLQSTDVGPRPRLIRIESRAGHGAGKGTDKVIDEYAALWAFFAFHTGLPAPRATSTGGPDA